VGADRDMQSEEELDASSRWEPDTRSDKEEMPVAESERELDDEGTGNDDWDEAEEENGEDEEAIRSGKPSATSRIARSIAPVPKPPAKLSAKPPSSLTAYPADGADGAEKLGEEDLEDVVGLSEGDRDYLFGGTDDDMVSYPKDDIIAIPEKDREFLFGGIKDESVSRPSESTIKDLVEVDKETQEYLTGGVKEVTGSGSGTDGADDTSDLLEVTEKDKEFLFGGTDEITGRRPDEEDEPDRGIGRKVDRKRKVKYSVGSRTRKGKSKKEQDRDMDKFLFGTKGVL